jgi:hypothetical protein
MIASLSACKENCDDVFRIHTVEVRGDGMQEAYTVRTFTGDTINRTSEVASDTTIYQIAGDEFQGNLRDGGENFLFHVVTNDSLYQYNYVFENGDCHVEKLSGHDRITLE